MGIVEPKISVIVPMYNVEKYIGQCIESILKQSYPHFELIIINDGSIDNSYSIAKYYADSDSRIILLNQTNSGVSSARNAGLERADGDYITFVDSDDWIEPDLFHKYIEEATRSSCDLVFSDNYYINEDRLMNSDEGWLSRRKNALDSYLLLPSPISGSRTFYKKTILQNERFNIKLHFHEDSEFQIRILKKAPVAREINYPGYHYRQGSVTHSVFSKKTLSVFDTIKEVINDFDGTVSDELTYRIASFIIAVMYIAAKDKEHDKKLDIEFRKALRPYLKKLLQSNLISIKNKIKLISFAISPKLAYRMITA